MSPLIKSIQHFHGTKISLLILEKFHHIREKVMFVFWEMYTYIHSTVCMTRY